ncbi:C-type lectin domain protein [Richelia sinica FACHB-800]|uniref:C-type lectin domain protein n=1 Tax=Richelia sinica FACHB-800 TaxID=1357546 RepID=A0A975Y575_9NOST|nr:lectin-like protein [Richelia sinica]QXE23940.1 C-type lectin domain protein [Richelia sinica FACHB-800]
MISFKNTTSALMKNLSVVAATAALSLGVSSAASAATFTYGGNEYFLTTLDTWTGAQAQAQSAGGNLVTINDAAEQAWLVSTFGATTRYWIGLTDRVTEGSYAWVSGEPVTYTNWALGEPNNTPYPPDGEDYIAMNWVSDGSGGWNDLPNAGPGFQSTYGIIERKVPEPATLGGLVLIGAASVLLKKKKLYSA